MTVPRLEHDVELSEEEFRLLRDFVHERFGLYFDGTQRGRLRARLAPRLALLGLVSFEDYYRHLRFAPERAQEQQRMVSHLTNNETYFFREQPQLEVFSSKVLPSLKERQSKRRERVLRLVSVGCSTGEEALTLAMIVFDSGQFFWGWDVEVTGLDVDEAALEKAPPVTGWVRANRSRRQARSPATRSLGSRKTGESPTLLRPEDHDPARAPLHFPQSASLVTAVDDQLPDIVVRHLSDMPVDLHSDEILWGELR